MSVGTWELPCRLQEGGREPRPSPAWTGAGGRVPPPRAHGGGKGTLTFSGTAGHYQLTLPGTLALVFKRETCLQLCLFSLSLVLISGSFHNVGSFSFFFFSPGGRSSLSSFGGRHVVILPTGAGAEAAGGEERG